MRRSLAVSLALLALLSAPVAAQTCLGLASYSDGPLQVNGNSWLASEASSFGAGVAYGRPSSVFGGLTIGTTSNEAVEGSSLDLGATLGYQIPLGKAARFHLCPVASFGVGIGPTNTFNSGVDRSTTTVSAGMAVASSLVAGPRVKVVPTLGLAYGYRRTKAENTAGASLFEITENYARVQLGIGLVLNSNISIRPGMDIPLGLGDSDPIIGMTVGYNFGHSRSPAARR